MKTALGLLAVAYAFGLVNGKVTKWGRDENEVEYRPAQETLGFMPSLINAALAPMTTSPPQYVPRHLEKRASSDNTCGYVSGSADFPLYCSPTAFCASNSQNSHVGCCPDSATTTCDVWTTCLDSSQRSQFTTDNGLTLWCGFSSYPHCITHIYGDITGAATALRGYTLYGCAVAAGSDRIYYNPFIFATSTSSSSRKTTATPTSDTSTTTGTSTTGRPTTTVTQSATPTPTPAPVPIAAIAGGVVGGVAALALIAFGIWFLMRQSKKDKEDDQPLPPGPGGAPHYPFGGGGTPATQMSQPGNGYFAPQPEAAGVAGVAGFAAMNQNQRSSIAKPGYTGYDQQQQYNVSPGGLGISPSPPESPPLGQQAPPYTSGAQGTPPPMGSDGRYSSYGQVQSSGTGSPIDTTGYAAAAAAGYHHRESQSTQGGYQGQQDRYSRQQSPGAAGGYQDGGYDAQDRYQQPAPAAMRESYQQAPISGGYQSQQQQDNYQQPPVARESYQQRPEPAYQAYHPGASQAQGYQQSQSQPQPPTNYHPPQPVYQPHPTGGYRNTSGYATELPTVRGDGEVRELQG